MSKLIKFIPLILFLAVTLTLFWLSIRKTSSILNDLTTPPPSIAADSNQKYQLDQKSIETLRQKFSANSTTTATQ